VELKGYMLSVPLGLKFKSSQNCSKLFEGSNVFELPLVRIPVKCLMLTAYHQL